NYDALNGSVITTGTTLGNASITTTGSNTIDLENMVVGGTLSVVGSGDSHITQNASLAVTGTSTFSASANDITLEDAGNDFADVVLVGNDVSIVDTNAVVLNGTGTLIAGGLAVTAGGNITQSGTALSITGGVASLDGNDITLNNAANNFSTVSANGSDVVLADIGSIILANSIVTNSLTVTANGISNISQIGTITGGAAADFTAFIIDLPDNNDFNSLAIAANTATVNDVNGLSLDTSSATSYDLTTNGNIDQTGALTLTTATINSSNNDITLDNMNNDFGTVVLDAGTAGDITVEDTNAIILGTTDANDLNVIAHGGTILQSGVITAGGTSNLSAVGNNITLMNGSNNFNTLGLTGANINIVDTNNIDLTNSTVSGTLSITANNITDSGALDINGTTFLDANGNDITLDNTGNDFSTVDINNTVQNVVLEDANSIILAAAIINNTLDVTANGAITQSGALNGNADASFDATASNITLTNNTNDFNSISLTGGNATLNNSDAIDLNTSSISGNLTLAVINAGDITQSGAIAVNGDAGFSVNSGQSVFLDDTSNNLQGNLFFTSNTAGNLMSVTLANNAALNLGDITVTDELMMSANGAISSSGILTVGTIAGFNANGSSVTLDNAANDFTDLVLASASSANIVDSNDLNLGASLGAGFNNGNSNISGNLNITTAGNLTDNNSTNVTVGGTASLDIGGNVTLDAVNNDFNAVNIVSAQNVDLTDANAINLQSSQI
ncbi:MAG: S-layer family protein, partial [Aestuariibacter sp.]|nr:S-layer family protein [Aestuariibacter sp.]